MNRLAIVLGSSALLAALLAGGYALAADKFSIAPLQASVYAQRDGACRGAIKYAITLTDADVASGFDPVSGTLEVLVDCSLIGTLASGAAFDAQGGKLDVSTASVTVAVAAGDPDGVCVPEDPKDPDDDVDGDGCSSGGPRLAGECDRGVAAAVYVADVASRKVFSSGRVERKTLPDSSCSALTAILDAACVIDSGGWPVEVAMPIAKCK